MNTDTQKHKNRSQGAGLFLADTNLKILLSVWNYSWRSVLVALGYLAGLILASIMGAIFGEEIPTEAGNSSNLVPLFIASMLLGVFLGPFASRLALSPRQHLALWGSLILFNLGSVIIEGAYFAPNLVSIPVSVLIVQQLLATTGAALVITKVFAVPAPSISWTSSLQQRPWYSWTWRFIASAFSYLVFYFVFGNLNYQLVTQPYYESHAGGLTVPASEVIFIVESIRSVIIVFSVYLFLLSIRGTRHQLIISTGWLLFAIGGIIPLFWQIDTLPIILLVASAVEILFQNFFTGAVAALLLGQSE